MGMLKSTKFTPKVTRRLAVVKVAIGCIWWSMPKSLPSHNVSVSELLPFSKVRLVVADLDGTLLQQDGQLWKKIREMRRNVSRYKVRFTIATGRTFTGVKPVTGLLESPGMLPMILYNGGVIVDPREGKLLQKMSLPVQRLQHILDIAKEWSVNVFAYYWITDDEMFFDPGIKLGAGEVVLGWSQSTIRPAFEFNGQPIGWQDEWRCPANASPCAVLIDVENCGLSREELYIQFARVPEVNVTKSGDRFLEIRPMGVNKWKGVLWITDKMGISPAEVLAIGDNENDAEMLKFAGIGVAVRNTPPSVSEFADYVCSRDAASGSIEVLRLIKVARRLSPGLGPFR